MPSSPASARAPRRRRPSRPIACTCASSPGCRRSKSGTAGSSFHARSGTSTTPCSNAGWRRSSTRPAAQLERDDNFPHLVKGGKIADKRPTIYHFNRKTDPRQRVDPQEVFASYRKRLTPERLCLFDRYVLKDTAFKAVGVGSVGTFCAVSLFMCGDGSPMFLQFKEARKSALECLGPKFSGHPGRRVVEGQRTMQAASDIFLGWTEDEISGPALLRAAIEEPAARIDRRARRGEGARRTTRGYAGARSPAPMRAPAIRR